MILLKKTIVFAVFCSLFLFGVVSRVTAQNIEINFKHLSAVDGLSNFTVLGIAQDHCGFMWIGTDQGDYIVKPFNVKDLRLWSRNLIKQRKVLKERFGQSGFMLPIEISLTLVDEKLMQRSKDQLTISLETVILQLTELPGKLARTRQIFIEKWKH